jgi:VWFA-related protein
MRPLVLLFAVATLAVASVSAQRFASRVDLVTVDALAVDGRHPIRGLTDKDFELYDNGVPQTIRLIQTRQAALNVIFVFDTSSSVEGPRLANLKGAAASVVATLGPDDRVALLSFSNRVRLHSPLSTDRARFATTIASLEADGTTALRDAVSTGVIMRGSDPGRVLMVLFTDGVDTSSFLFERSVLATAARSDVVIYPVAVRTRDPRPASLRYSRALQMADPPADERFLRALAAETGGRLEHADGDDDIDKAFARVFEEFKSRYVLGYVPTGVAWPGWHTIEVRLKNRKGTVTARRGYFGPSGARQQP